jgi:hypothetical protein
MTDLEKTLFLAEGAYSVGRYKNWTNVAKLLLKKGYSPTEAAAIMLSKLTRWAADRYETRYGTCPANAVIKYIEDPQNRVSPEYVAELVEGTTFPEWPDSRVADRIDGYDRDDLGESPDY